MDTVSILNTALLRKLVCQMQPGILYILFTCQNAATVTIEVAMGICEI